jgi:hypothetical protein
MTYDYFCPRCGIVTDAAPLERIQCRCGMEAKRRFGFSFSRSALRDQSRWDPVVGQYVANDREFRDALSRGQAREAAELGMDVPLVAVDARDTEALGELHGTGVDHRLEIAEQTARVNHDVKVVANKEAKPKVLTG